MFGVRLELDSLHEMARKLLEIAWEKKKHQDCSHDSVWTFCIKTYSTFDYILMRCMNPQDDQEAERIFCKEEKTNLKIKTQFYEQT